MKNYEFSAIEKKWQDIWDATQIYKVSEDKSLKKFYTLVEFPYPSGEGLHVGHVKGQTAVDIFARFKRMQGYNVLNPMGWDAFGLPAENFAIKHKKHPAVFTQKNIDNFRRQSKSFGPSFDWSKEIDTTDPEYYKWTQWIFIQLFNMGLAYEKEAPINWCPSCKTGLANEEVIDGHCERCDTQVVQKNMKQWYLKITDYAEKLIDDLADLNWPEYIKTSQKNWIGKSEGVEFSMKKSDDDTKSISVYTTRIDTVFGMTYAVIAPDFSGVDDFITDEKRSECERYIEESKKKSDMDRTELAKEKTGVNTGSFVINPFNNEKIPVFIGDYVLGNYGTGAVMAVPAHDERDFEFAKRFGIEIRQSILPKGVDHGKTKKLLEVANEINELSAKSGIPAYICGGIAVPFNTGVVYRQNGDLDYAVKADHYESSLEMLQQAGFTFIKKRMHHDKEIAQFEKDGVEVEILQDNGETRFEDGESLVFGNENIDDNIKTLWGFKAKTVDFGFYKKIAKTAIRSNKAENRLLDISMFEKGAYTEDGILMDSGEFTGLSSEEARKQMSAWLEKEKKGKAKVNYKLRDWLFSRQRYWGEPIPIIKCDRCGLVPVPENELPLLLPEVENYEPTGTGESPLAHIDSWVNTVCPHCGGAAKRETNTMPQWAGSSWYFLRYIDPKNKDAMASKENLDYFMPVDVYFGGAEHTTVHLLYSRFWNKALFDKGVVPVSEPYKRRVQHGLILGEDGRKMSKRWGNVINPDDVIKEFGADTMRTYIMFMGPYGDSSAWSTTTIMGLHRFLNKIWALQDKVSADADDSDLEVLMHKTIKKVTDDIEAVSYHTAISQMMILMNSVTSKQAISKALYETLLKLISPFAPHITEELWHILGNESSIHLSRWPVYDEAKLIDKVIKVVVQINGKVRDELEVDFDSSEDIIKEKAFASEAVRKHIGSAEIRKIVYVKNKLLSIVV